jgi:hypothetical protein
MGRTSNAQIDIMELEDPHNEFGLLDFDNRDSSEHPEWQIDDALTPQELARIDSDAEIYEYRMNGYE